MWKGINFLSVGYPEQKMYKKNSLKTLNLVQFRLCNTNHRGMTTNYNRSSLTCPDWRSQMRTVRSSAQLTSLDSSRRKYTWRSPPVCPANFCAPKPYNHKQRSAWFNKSHNTRTDYDKGLIERVEQTSSWDSKDVKSGGWDSDIWEFGDKWVGQQTIKKYR